MTSKSKGNTFERKISKLLSDRFSKYTGIEQAFRRNIDSGSFFGGSNQRRTATHNLETACFGDIICPSDFRYSIECKHYKTPPSFKMVIQENIKQWDTWLEQAKQDSANSDKEMLVIVKYNGIDEIVITDLEVPLKPLYVYKGYKVYLLETYLTLENSYFFTPVL